MGDLVYLAGVSLWGFVQLVWWRILEPWYHFIQTDPGLGLASLVLGVEYDTNWIKACLLQCD